MDHTLHIDRDRLIVACPRCHLELRPMECGANRVQPILPALEAAVHLGLIEQRQRLAIAVVPALCQAESASRRHKRLVDTLSLEQCP